MNSFKLGLHDNIFFFKDLFQNLNALQFTVYSRQLHNKSPL